MSEDQGGGRLGGEAREIDTIPGGDGGGEDTRRGTERWGCIVTDTEAVAIVRTADVKPETRIIGLSEDGMYGVQHEVREEDGIVALVDLDGGSESMALCIEDPLEPYKKSTHFGSASHQLERIWLPTVNLVNREEFTWIDFWQGKGLFQI